MADEKKVEATEVEATDAAKDGKKLKDPQLKEVVGGLNTPAVPTGDAKLNAVSVTPRPVGHK